MENNSHFDEIIFEKEDNRIPLKIVLALDLICSLACLTFLAFKLKLNAFIKTILVIVVCFNSICLGIVLAAQLANEDWKCKVTIKSGLTIFGTFPMCSLISILRLYMTKLANKAKIAKKYHIIPVIILCTICFYGLGNAIVVLNEYFGFKTANSICTETENKPSNPIAVFVFCIIFIGTCVAGLVCDVLLYKFIRKTHPNSNQESNLIPWKSTNSKAEEDLQVPLRASFISIFVTFSTIIIMTFFSASILGVYPKFAWKIFVITFFTLPTFLPINLTIFTVKKHNKIHVSQPPPALQFHEENVIELENIE